MELCVSDLNTELLIETKLNVLRNMLHNFINEPRSLYLFYINP